MAFLPYPGSGVAYLRRSNHNLDPVEATEARVAGLLLERSLLLRYPEGCTAGTSTFRVNHQRAAGSNRAAREGTNEVLPRILSLLLRGPDPSPRMLRLCPTA